MRSKVIGLIVCGFFGFGARETEAKEVAAQPRMQFDTESVDALLKWFDDGSPLEAIPELTTLPANRFMEQLLLQNEVDAGPFADALAAFAEDHTRSEYLLAEAYTRREQIAALARAVADPSVAEGVLQYVMDYFPQDFDAGQLPAYEVWFTATGWQWGDAMMFSYDPETLEVGEGGKPATIFDLTLISSLYGNGVQEQLGTFKNVLKHELFHAVLADYRTLKQIPEPETTEEQADYLLYNEGIAHYLANPEIFRQQSDELKEKEQAAFRRYSEQRRVIFDATRPEEVRMAAIQQGVQGPYWDKYIAVTGLFMAARIEQLGGRELLRECIARGPEYFIDTYYKITNTSPPTEESHASDS